MAKPVMSHPGTFGEVLTVFTRLGLTSFGGPVAHLGYFYDELVIRRQWLDEQTYADIVALCQFLPGPASSQVGISLGIVRSGLWGGLAAWLGFTLPSALAMGAFAVGVTWLDPDAKWLHGLNVVAVAVVAQAVWTMATKLCPDRLRATFAFGAALMTLFWPTGITQIALIIVGGLLGWRLLEPNNDTPATLLQITIPRMLAVVCLGGWALLLILVPLLRQLTLNQGVALFDSFFRTGSLVFGGGHVVLPLLQAEVVPTGWVTTEQFIAGYGAAQAVPGPLFTFSAYLGAIAAPNPNGWLGAAIAVIAIFLPSFLLLIGVLPFWNTLRMLPPVQAVLRGVNAVVVGILLAALYTPVWTSAIHTAVDFGLALVAFGLLAIWKWSSWVVVVLIAIGGGILALV